MFVHAHFCSPHAFALHSCSLPLVSGGKEEVNYILIYLLVMPLLWQLLPLPRRAQ